jgi:hypothetical protein
MAIGGNQRTEFLVPSGQVICKSKGFGFLLAELCVDVDPTLKSGMASLPHHIRTNSDRVEVPTVLRIYIGIDQGS